jgi:hypothetical protein
MFLLWPDVLFFLSDAAPYMVKAGKTIGALYSKMVHVTCLAHGVHKVTEERRRRFTKVDKLISKVKQIFLKSPARVFFFLNRAPNVPLPPEPIINRWGTWLRAASYYCTYLQEIKNIVLELNQNDAISIKKLKKY